MACSTGSNVQCSTSPLKSEGRRHQSNRPEQSWMTLVTSVADAATKAEIGLLANFMNCWNRHDDEDRRIVTATTLQPQPRRGTGNNLSSQLVH
eukprot:CAMPEP_0119116178 /NCGR_PEP_ID=MMETSP1180-20130426/52142_1 /TAXON_ID=3052 ORGANISM="Chlamydomonas cf sp, Strain CCMP681" /NCGR_SAMPLE_ID=MMETSP1180 /ASSEMBLY_ACC=CAM_ASM_000741 /LENGTH=92 /DNA_ID=CAMNT_0007105299 /DNA_START=311 /DNA_END=589 /DNA_ORIENTATION=+